MFILAGCCSKAAFSLLTAQAQRIPTAGCLGPWLPRWTPFSVVSLVPAEGLSRNLPSPATSLLNGTCLSVFETFPFLRWLDYRLIIDLSTSEHQWQLPACGNGLPLNFCWVGSMHFGSSNRNMSDSLSVVTGDRIAVIPLCCQINKGNPSALSYSFL